MLKYLHLTSKKIEELSSLKFLSNDNENLKKLILDLITDGNADDLIQEKVKNEYEKLVKEIKENSSIQIILKDKKDEGVIELLDEIIIELKDLNNLRKIESLEKDLINNLDENSYSELIKLKSQLNRE